MIWPKYPGNSPIRLKASNKKQQTFFGVDWVAWLFHPNRQSLHENGWYIMLNSWLHIDPTSCGRRFSQFRWSRLTTKTRISGHSRRAIFYSNFVSFATKCFRFCPLRFRGRLLRLLRCLITRTIKLLTLERSIFFFKNYQKHQEVF